MMSIGRTPRSPMSDTCSSTGDSVGYLLNAGQLVGPEVSRRQRPFCAARAAAGCLTEAPRRPPTLARAQREYEYRRSVMATSAGATAAATQSVAQSASPGDDPAPTLRDSHRQMALIRAFELRAAQMYQRVKIDGYCHLNLGVEVTVGGGPVVRSAHNDAPRRTAPGMRHLTQAGHFARVA